MLSSLDIAKQKLIEISIALSSETDLSELLKKIIFELRVLTNADGGSLFLVSNGNLRFEVAQNNTLILAKGEDFQFFKQFEIPISEQSIAGYVALTGKILNIPDVYNLAAHLPYRFDPSFDLRNNYRTQSILAVPLKDHTGTVIGVLELINAMDGQDKVPFREAYENVVLSLASLAAVAINKARLIQTIQDLLEAEKEQYRRNLEAIFRSVNDAIITVDKNMRIIAANDAVRGICSIDPQAIINHQFHDVTRYCSQSCVRALKEILEKGRTIKEYRLECGNQYRPHQLVSVSSSPLRDKADKNIGTVLVIRDLTRVAEMEGELRERYNLHNIVGKSHEMQKIFHLLDELMNTDTTVLITGETGTGKELVAKALHYGGPRAAKPLITVNCSALAENLLESELFGHVKGAFTGAQKDRIGRFQAAHGGTIFLDEVGDIPPRLQLKLLRVLQEKTIERVGDSTTCRVDVRVIAATNRHLKQRISQGEFREDLYYRLKVLEIALPGLRERREDIPLLIQHFLTLFNKSYHKNIEEISQEALKTFMIYPWPGNVRELQHAIEHAYVLCNGPTIALEHIPAEIRDFQFRETPATGGRLKSSALQTAEILQALTETGWNKAKAARRLGISRPTLYQLINLHHLEPSDHL
ncbi:MAG: sigma 54-interacting transcriptional regulator [Syntrophobacterales bacterium]|jgi:PAS domain S-box-containing protein|nr:sigma 54-interacting transcriptional regulator [Syntrophobacterales bacterium]